MDKRYPRDYIELFGCLITPKNKLLFPRRSQFSFMVSERINLFLNLSNETLLENKFPQAKVNILLIGNIQIETLPVCQT